MMYDAIAPLAMLAMLAIAVSAFIICARRDTVPEPFDAEHVLDEVCDSGYNIDEDDDEFLEYFGEFGDFS